MSFFSQWLGVFQEKFTIFSDKVSVDAQEGIESIGGGVQGVSSLTAYLEGVFEYLEPFLYIVGLSISIGITALGFFQNLNLSISTDPGLFRPTKPSTTERRHWYGTVDDDGFQSSDIHIDPSL